MRKIVICFLLLLTVTGLFATRLYVPTDYHYISLAILAASDGDSVIVEPGTYAGVIGYEGKAITIASLYIFSGNEEDIHHTVLTGHYSDSPLITFGLNENENSILNGFTITNSASGGAISCDGASPVLRNLRFIDNQSSAGSAIYTNLSEPTVENCVFEGNSGTEFGGAIYLEESDLTISNSTFTGNSCDGGGNLGRGGCIFVSNSTADISYCSFIGNSANMHSGAVYLSYGSANIDHTLFAENTSSAGNVGALYFYNSDDLVVSNCTFYNNSGANAGALRFYSAENPTTPPIIINTICRGNSPLEIFFSSDNSVDEIVLANCDIEGMEAGIETNGTATVTWLETNVDEDPMFLAPEFDHYYLDTESPCIDAGINYFEFEGTTYLDTQDYIGTAPDLGACESDADDNYPLAMFSYDIDTGEVPFEVSFTDESIGDVVSWEWDFNNDGLVDSEDQNPYCIYNVDGIYSVKLTITTENHTVEKLMVDLIDALAPSGSDEELPEITTDFKVYPNPFNPSSNISFELQKDEHVEITAYNLKGQLQETIVSKNYHAGLHQITWEPQNMSSGVYLIKMQNTNSTKYQRVLLLK